MFKSKLQICWHQLGYSLMRRNQMKNSYAIICMGLTHPSLWICKLWNCGPILAIGKILKNPAVITKMKVWWKRSQVDPLQKLMNQYLNVKRRCSKHSFNRCFIEVPILSFATVTIWSYPKRSGNGKAKGTVLASASVCFPIYIRLRGQPCLGPGNLL